MARAKANEALVQSTASANKEKVASGAAPASGTKPSAADAGKVLDLLQDPKLTGKEKTAGLNDFLARPEGGKVLMESIGSDVDKLDTLFKFEKKPLTGKSDQVSRQNRLEKMIPNLSSDQIKASIQLDGFRAIMSDVNNGEGGYATTIAYSLSAEQFGELASEVKDRDQASAMLTALTKLNPSDDDDGGKVSGDKLFAVLSQFDDFSPDVQSAVKNKGLAISGQVRQVQGGGEVAALKQLVKGLKL